MILLNTSAINLARKGVHSALEIFDKDHRRKVRYTQTLMQIHIYLMPFIPLNRRMYTRYRRHVRTHYKHACRYISPIHIHTRLSFQAGAWEVTGWDKEDKGRGGGLKYKNNNAANGKAYTRARIHTDVHMHIHACTDNHAPFSHIDIMLFVYIRFLNSSPTTYKIR